MDVKNIVKNYLDYELNYFIQPGLWMDDNEIIALKNSLDYVNKLSGKNFCYGVFSKDEDSKIIHEFFSKTNLCLMKLQGEPIGFFYNFIVQEIPKPIIHAGLVVITKNSGVDLLAMPYIYLAILQWKKYGTYYYTNISSTPSIIGAFGEVIMDVWPSHRSSNVLKPPHKEYYAVLNQLHNEYITRYFPEERILIDTKRFVMKSPSKEMGFETNLRSLPRHANLKVNLFCHYWIDYAQGEDMIQVGRVNLKFVLKGKLFFLVLNIKKKLQLLLNLPYLRWGIKNSKQSAG